MLSRGKLLLARRLVPGTLATVVVYAGYVSCLLLLIATAIDVVAGRLDAPVQRLLAYSAEPVSQPPKRLQVSAVLEGDSWAQNLKTQRFWGGGRRSNLQGPAAPDAWLLPGLDSLTQPFDGSGWFSARRGSTHRTVCVRLCDGYFWPISFSTTSDNFERDQNMCEQSCTSPAKLFVYENPGQEPEQMVDVKGQPYSKLKSAFLFRSKFDASCKCNPHPWEQEAMNRHKQYAALDAQLRRDKKDVSDRFAQAKRVTQPAVLSPSRSSAKPQLVPSPPIVAGRRATLEPDLKTPASSAPAEQGVRVAVLNASALPSPAVRTQLSPGPSYVAPGVPAGQLPPSKPVAAIEVSVVPTSALKAAATGVAAEPMTALPSIPAASPASLQALTSPSGPAQRASPQPQRAAVITTQAKSPRSSGNWQTKVFEAR